MKVLRILSALLTLAPAPALATSVNLAVPTGIVDLVPDGTNNAGLSATCGNGTAATLFGTCQYQWIINAAGQGLILSPSVGGTSTSVPPDADYIGISLGGTLTGVTGHNVGGSIGEDVNVLNTLTINNPSIGVTGVVAPGQASYIAGVSSGNLTGIIQADHSVPISIATATTTQLVAISGTTKIYVTAANVVAAGTGNVTFVYGTGTNCGTGQSPLTGAYNLTAQSGLALGGSIGPVLVVPSGQALCALTSAAVQMSGSVAYTQF